MNLQILTHSRRESDFGFQVWQPILKANIAQNFLAVEVELTRLAVTLEENLAVVCHRICKICGRKLTRRSCLIAILRGTGKVLFLPRFWSYNFDLMNALFWFNVYCFVFVDFMAITFCFYYFSWLAASRDCKLAKQTWNFFIVFSFPICIVVFISLFSLSFQYLKSPCNFKIFI